MDDCPDMLFRVLSCNEVWIEDDAGPVFDHRIVVLRSGESYFYGRDPRRKGTIEPTALDLRQIPFTHFRAPFNADLTIAPDTLLGSREVYIKEPSLISYGHASPSEQQAYFEPQLQEAIVYEKLRLSPHPNIGVYYGCIVEDGLIKAFCLKRYDRTLMDLVKEGTLSHAQKEAYMDGIESGVAHLHALGFVHGDINPSNIMMDSARSTTVLIDFDSCRPRGSPVGQKVGTPGWGLADDYDVAQPEQDLVALRQIRRFLMGD